MAELTATRIQADAERIVLDRLGTVEAIADRWNVHERARREKKRRRLAAAALAVVATGALGLTQYAAGTPQPRKTHQRRDVRCERAAPRCGSLSERALQARHRPH